jgi:hypothetical protein
VLTPAANDVARSLGSQRKELQLLRQLAVDVLPAATGALAGAVMAGPLGAAAGGLVAGSGKALGKLVAEKVIVGAQQSLFGWVLEGLTHRSARKPLARAMRTDLDLQGSLRSEFRIIWEAPRQTT